MSYVGIAPVKEESGKKRSGKSHPKAIRALAYKWGRILWRCWQDGVPYDEEKYLAALRRKRSPLVKLLGIQSDAEQQILEK
jgi:hypothetical protein